MISCIVRKRRDESRRCRHECLRHIFVARFCFLVLINVRKFVKEQSSETRRFSAMAMRFFYAVGLIASRMIAADVSSAPVTFHRDVLPILQKNCQTCHRPGQAGPMTFLTYESTRPWAKAMKEAVLLRKMPPWFADAKVGH